MPNKYKKGITINSMTLLTIEVEAGRWVYYRERPLHPGFILNMSFGTVLGGLRSGKFIIAQEA